MPKQIIKEEWFRSRLKYFALLTGGLTTSSYLSMKDRIKSYKNRFDLRVSDTTKLITSINYN